MARCPSGTQVRSWSTSTERPTCAGLPTARARTRAGASGRRSDRERLACRIAAARCALASQIHRRVRRGPLADDVPARAQAARRPRADRSLSASSRRRRRRPALLRPHRRGGLEALGLRDRRAPGLGDDRLPGGLRRDVHVVRVAARARGRGRAACSPRCSGPDAPASRRGAWPGRRRPAARAGPAPARLPRDRGGRGSRSEVERFAPLRPHAVVEFAGAHRPARLPGRARRPRHARGGRITCSPDGGASSSATAAAAARRWSWWCAARMRRALEVAALADRLLERRARAHRPGARPLGATGSRRCAHRGRGRPAPRRLQRVGGAAAAAVAARRRPAGAVAHRDRAAGSAGRAHGVKPPWR